MSVWRLLVGSTAAILLVGPVPAAGATPATVPCPRATTGAEDPGPPRPTPPVRDPNLPTVGGDALGTAGLVTVTGTRTPPAITATSWLVADLDSAEVLGTCGPHERATPASVQKLLLVAAAMPELDPKQVVTVTERDLNLDAESSVVGLLPGGRYPVETLWLGLLLRSGNDAANVLARLRGGESAAAGVAAMNAEAKRLGAYDTHAVTPSGLDGPGQFTSAYDLALIARVCFARDDFRRYVTTRTAEIPPQPPREPNGFQVENDNQLLWLYPGALGAKSGFTSLARHTFVGAAQRGKRRLVVTLMGAESDPHPGWQQAAALLDWGFALPERTSVGRLVDPDELRPSTAAPTPPANAAAVGTGQVARTGGWSRPVLTALAVAGLTLVLVALLATALTRRQR
jgi:D-alanyl-D-alanine carboxypeptidase (penicillin-binding protein 5/6)